MNKLVAITLMVTSSAVVSVVQRDAPLLTVLAGYLLTFACGMLAGVLGRR